MDESIYLNTVVPLKTNNACATVAITTPSNDMNWFQFLQDIKDSDGHLLFKTYYKGTACPVCIRRRRADTCEHKQLPPWKSQRGIETVKAILEKKTAVWNKEVQGVMTTDQVQVFAKYIKGFLSLPLYEFAHPVALTFTFIDRGGQTICFVF